MKVLREVYDFITGGSIAAPIGLIVAILAARFGVVPFFVILLAAFAASTFERAL